MTVSQACQTFVPMLSPFIDGELPPTERVTVERHLAACKDCTMRAADLRAESGLLRVGMELAADQVDFKDFSQKVMARITPERPPLFERLKVSASEAFLYQRGTWVTAMASAAVVMLVALPFILRERTPTGYASERMAVQSVSTEDAANVAPVVFETKSGNAIIWVVDHPPAKPGAKDDEAVNEELELDSSPSTPQPNGGEL
ncbi:MAG: anti-sigma factor [Myxococcaceae bacterium]